MSHNTVDSFGSFHSYNDFPSIENHIYKAWHKHGKKHRLYKPALIYKVYMPISEEWWIEGNDITRKVVSWAKEHNYPTWDNWDDIVKLHFKLTFL